MEEYNKLYFGDCLEIMKNIKPKSVNMILTDPPYLHEKGRLNGMLTGQALDIKGYNMTTLGEFDKDKIYEFLNITKPLMIQPKYFMFCSEKQVPFYTMWAVENKLKFNILAWCKPNGVTDRRRYSTNIEYIVRIYGNGCTLNKLDFDKYPEKIVYYSKWKTNKRITGKQRLHPSEKPVDILKEIIELNSSPNDVILDPYMGSCSTGEAVVKVGERQFIGIEKVEKYYKVACDRIEKLHAS